MRKLIYIIGVVGVWLLNACSVNDPKLYSGDSKIQFGELKDTVLRYSFYFIDTTVKQDTIFVELNTIGYTSKQDRAVRIEILDLEDAVKPTEGIHYMSLNDPEFIKNCVVKGNCVSTRVPFVIYRDKLEDYTTYELKIGLVDNENFVLGLKERLWRKLVFAKGLLCPTLWTDFDVKYTWGVYSNVKHSWMIKHTGKDWDDKFLEEMAKEPGASGYWKKKLNSLLLEYLKTNPPLVDENEVEITGFPK